MSMDVWTLLGNVFPVVNAGILLWVVLHLPARTTSRSLPEKCPITNSSACLLFSDPTLLCADCRAKVVARMRQEEPDAKH